MRHIYVAIGVGAALWAWHNGPGRVAADETSGGRGPSVERSTSAERFQTVRAQPKRRTRSRDRKVRVRGDRQGHFYTSARMNGRSVKVVVDTGASFVAINRSTARRLGLRLRKHHFVGRAKTANGTVSYAPAIVDEIRIGGIRVKNVRVGVLPDRALSTTLLGMSFLKRLRGFSVSNNQLLLEG